MRGVCGLKLTMEGACEYSILQNWTATNRAKSTGFRQISLQEPSTRTRTPPTGHPMCLVGKEGKAKNQPLLFFGLLQFFPLHIWLASRCCLYGLVCCQISSSQNRRLCSSTFLSTGTKKEPRGARKANRYTDFSLPSGPLTWNS